MDATPLLSLENVTKRYGNLVAVDGLTLQVAPGEFFGFLGPNGAGKTTTVRMLAGLARPDSGAVSVRGMDMAKDPVAAKRHIGLIPDRPFLYGKLRGEEFLHFIADLYGVDEAALEERMDSLFRMFRLSEWRSELVESYSHGMRQKLVFCAALLHEPDVLLVDEPLVGLDPEGIGLVKRLMKEHCERGGAVFMSTHSLEIVEALCHRVGIMHRGRLVALGTPTEVKALASRKDSAPSAALEEAFFALTREEPE